MGTLNINIKSKRYFNNLVLEDFKLDLPYGAIVGLLGLNGAGKTTLFDCMMGLEDYKGDTFNVSKGDLSYMCIRRNLFADMRIVDAINFYNDFYQGFDKSQALIDLHKLKLPMKKRIRTLSAGQYRIITFVLAINCKARIYLFDEPVSNLDILYKEFMIDKLINTICDDKLYIVSSHELHELENIYSHIAIIKDKNCTPLVSVEDIRLSGKSIAEYYKGVVVC